MDKKFLGRLTRSFEKRGGTFGVEPGARDEDIVALLDQLLDCPDCRAAVVEACNADDQRDVDIDEVIRGLALNPIIERSVRQNPRQSCDCRRAARQLFGIDFVERVCCGVVTSKE